MLTFKRLILVASVSTLLALTGAVQAAGRAVVTVAYRGWTTQTFPATPTPTNFHGVIRIDVDRTNHRVAFVGLRLNCTSTSGYVVTAHPQTKIDRHGNFRYKPTTSHLAVITGHVTKTRITGAFKGTKSGCSVNGKYSVVPRATWPPEPTP